MKAKDLIAILQEYGPEKEVRFLHRGTDHVEDPSVSCPIKGVFIEQVGPKEVGADSPDGDITLGDVIYLLREDDYDAMKNGPDGIQDDQLWTPPAVMVPTVRVMILGTEKMPYLDMPWETLIENTVQGFQNAVGGGFFEVHWLPINGFVFSIYVNDRRDGLQATTVMGGHTFYGPVVISQVDQEGEMVSLTDEEVAVIHEYYRAR